MLVIVPHDGTAMAKAVREHNEDGKFAAFLAYEWSAIVEAGGHRFYLPMGFVVETRHLEVQGAAHVLPAHLVQHRVAQLLFPQLRHHRPPHRLARRPHGRLQVPHLRAALAGFRDFIQAIEQPCWMCADTPCVSACAPGALRRADDHLRHVDQAPKIEPVVPGQVEAAVAVGHAAATPRPPDPCVP